MEKIYNKLVRDRIPEIIMSKGETPVTRVLSVEEFKEALEEKLKEELKEVLSSKGKDRIEELADLLEVMKYLAKLENSSLEEVIETGKNKLLSRGGFEKRIFLEKVE